MILSLVSVAFAQTFTSTDVPIEITSNASIQSTLSVPDNGATIVDVNLTVDITHTFTNDLSITLRSPQGATVTVASNNGGSGDDFQGTVFDDSASISIVDGVAPFAGTFRPVLELGFFEGLEAGGTWTLIVADGFPGDEGTLNSWSIDLVTDSGALPELDFVESLVEADFGNVIDASAGSNAQPAVIAQRIDALNADLQADGCTVVDGLAGTYRRRRAPRQLGETQLGGEAIVGSDIGSLTVGAQTASASLASGGRIVGELADGTVMHGYFVRLNSSQAFWYGTLADCSVD